MIYISGGILFLLSILSLFLYKYFSNIKKQPGGFWFIYTIGSLFIWSISFSLRTLIPNENITHTLFGINLLFVNLSVIFMFIFIYEYIYTDKLHRKYVLILFIYPVINILFFFTNNTVYFSEYFINSNGIIIFESGVGLYIHILHNYILAICSFGMILGEYFSSKNTRKKQIRILLLGLIIYGFLSVFSVTNYIPPYFNTSPIGFFLFTVLIIYNFKKYQFLSDKIIKINDIFTKIENPILVLDEYNNIIKTNKQFNELVNINIRQFENIQKYNTNTIIAKITLLLNKNIKYETLKLNDEYYSISLKNLNYSTNKNGKIIILTNITYIKKQEQKLKTLKQKYESVIENFQKGSIALFNKELKYEFASGIIYSSEDNKNKHISEIHSSDFLKNYKIHFENVFNNIEHNEVITYNNKKLQVQFKPIFIDNNIEYGVIITTDITKQKKIEKELHNIRKLYARVLRHNIKNKLSIINSYTNIITKNKTKKELNELKNKILKATNDLNSQSEKTILIHNIIQKQNKTITVNIQKEITKIINKYSKKYPDVTIENNLKYNINKDVHIHFQNAIENIIENSIKHNDTNGLTITISDIYKKDNKYLIYIEDNGSKIREQEIDIFKNKKENDLEHGSGVGLYLIELVINKSNGKYIIMNKKEKGVRNILIFDD